jgi:hypothetical protein
MSFWKSCLGRAFGLLAAVSAATVGADDPRQAAPRKPARVYTNEDLERIHPLAAQTGGGSTPAVTTSDPEAEVTKPDSPTRGRGERYWRDEAARVRERVRALEERAAALRSKIAERERSRESPVYGRKGGSASKSDGLASLQASLAAVDRRIRSTRDDLEERARRDGALPGWLR